MDHNLLSDLMKNEITPFSSSLGQMPAYVINLDKRPDRLRDFTQACMKYQFGPVTRVCAVDQDTPAGWKVSRGNYGCIRSHQSIWKTVTQNTLILEDDAQLMRPFVLPPLPSEFDIFYLGGNDSKYSATPGPVYEQHQLGNTLTVVRKCTRLFTTHAYIVSPAGARAALAMDMSRWPIDVNLCELQKQGRCYYIRPSLFIQAPGHSDICGGPVDHSSIT